ncbi:MAG: hydroxymethylbilane synthase [Bryobacterales bacterium]|nr:hydroxymethylbilane synthase [Bryobacterales bacterium]MBV9400119.1 hydroxymethylbilane synthase [Bryobacterales bacterium]
MIVIGSRGSALALWQARHIAAALDALGAQTRIEVIKTTGDKIQDVPLAKAGGKGLFTKEIEEALLAREIDIAVHSLKDLPAIVPSGLTLAAIPEREEARDAWISGADGRSLSSARQGAMIGTSSLRRAAQLRAFRNDFIIDTLRGNVDTRLRKLDEGRYDAIVLAAAGLRRLGLQDRIRQIIPVEIMCPAVGQGALAIETRDDSGPAQELARKLDHVQTRIAVEAERALLSTLGGGCQVPVGAHATLEGDVIRMHAIVAAPDGSRLLRCDAKGMDPVQLGAQVGEQLLGEGAREILSEVYAA